MKVNLIIASCALASATLTTALAEMETNSIYVTMAQARASNDIRVVIRNLPNIETLWPEHPETYFRAAREAAQTLAGARRTAGAKQGLLSLWTNVLQKPLPADDQQALACIGLKRDMVLPLLHIDYISGAKSRWVDIARFLGQIRARIIPNYDNQGGLVSVAAHTPEAKLQLQRLLAENEKKNAADSLQAELRSTDYEAAFRLLHYVPKQFLKDAQFIKTVSSAAHLTIEEVKQLKGID
jgi:hypothetical protein